MDAEPKGQADRYRAEEEAKLKRRRFLVEREGIDKMTMEDMRRHLVTCDYRGCEVKGIILDTLIEKVGAASFESGLEAAGETL